MHRRLTLIPLDREHHHFFHISIVAELLPLSNRLLGEVEASLYCLERKIGRSNAEFEEVKGEAGIYRSEKRIIGE